MKAHLQIKQVINVNAKRSNVGQSDVSQILNMNNFQTRLKTGGFGAKFPQA